jgi:CheY-like chemotaxis protein
VIAALQQAREGSERIRITARDLKVFCHNDHSEPTSVDVRGVLESSITMAWNEIRHRARLVRVFADVARVDANENRLAQVFLNLLVNAAGLPGQRRGKWIRASTWHDDTQVIVEISDNGSWHTAGGHEAPIQTLLYQQAGRSGHRAGALDLPGIVTDLGGGITVRSQVGSGTTFRVALPRGALEETMKPSVLPSPHLEGRRGRVLVIDDEPALVRTIQRLLEGEHEVRASSDAKAALQMLASEQNFDVVLCDLMMPQMTGMEFHAELARAAPRMAERIVFLTAGAFTSTAKQFLDRVPNRRLEKPFDARALRATIHKLVARADIGSLRVR